MAAKPRISQQQFQSSAAPGQFNPSSIPDPNQGLNSKLSTIRSDFARMIDTEQATITNRAEQERKSLKNLSVFSETLKNTFDKGYEWYVKNEEEQADLMFEADKAAQLSASLNADLIDQKMQEHDSLHQQAAYTALKQGAPIEIVENIKNLSGIRGYFYRRNAAKFIGDKALENFQSRLLEDTTPITINGVTKAINDKTWGVAEHAAILKKLVGDYYQQSGLTDISRELQAKYALPQISEAQQKLMGIKRKEYGIVESQRNYDDAVANFTVDKNFTTLLQRLANTSTEDGPRLFTGAWKAGMQVMRDMFDTGQLTEADLQDIEIQVDPETGKRLKDRWPVQFRKFREELAAANRQNFADEEAERETLAKQAERDIMDYLEQNPDQATGPVLQSLKAEFFNKFDRESEALNKLESTYSIDAQNAQRMSERFKYLADRNQLTMEMVSQAPWDVRQKWMASAKAQDDARSKAGNYKTHLAAIEDEVKSDARLKPLGLQYTGLTTLVIGELQAKFNRKVAEYAATMPELPAAQAANQAVAEVMNEYKTSSRYAVDGLGKFVNFEKTLGSSATTKKLTAKINTVRKAIAYGGKAALNEKPGLIFDSTELIAIQRSYGQPGFRVPPQAQYWANQLNINPLEVINRQRIAAGMKELDTPGAIEAVQQRISPQLQSILNRYPSVNRSTRALSSMRTFVPEVIPNGYGKAIQAAAQANGIDPAILAGLLEVESGFRSNAMSRAGARGIAQIMPQYHPGVNPDDPIASINYAAKWLSSTQRQFGGDMRLALLAYNGGTPTIAKYRGPIPGSKENQEYYGKVIKAAAKYGYGRAWSDPATMRGKFRVTEYLTGDTNHAGYRADHGGGNYHEHIAFATKAERNAAIQKLAAAGIKVGSIDRPGDPGNHGKGLAIDIPAEQVPIGKEKELSRRVRSILGIS